MKISALTFMAFYVNSALDTGKYADVSIDAVRAEIRAGTIFSYLEITLENDIDLSIFDWSMRKALIEEWQDIEAATNIRKKFGIEKGGLTLLIAFLLESIQRRTNGKA